MMRKSEPNSWTTTELVKDLQLVILVIMLMFSLNLYAANKGRVIDEASGKPMEGVYVMAMWNASVASVVDAKSVCYHFAITQTDKEGNYELPSRSWNVWPFYYDRYISHEYYFPGYTSSSNNILDSDVWNMRRSTISPQDRIKSFIHSRYENCTSEGERNKVLVPLYQAQYEESTLIAKSEEEKKLLYSVKLKVINARVGNREFSKMQLEGKIK
jgi:hypothetical protein